MLNEFSLCDEQMIALRNEERLSRYTEAGKNYRMTTSLKKNSVIVVTGRFLVNTANRLLAIA